MRHLVRHALIGAISFLALAVHAASSGTAVSPARTSIEADFTQVFAARFHDGAGNPAVGESVTFSNDACGRFASGGFVYTTVTDTTGLATAGFTALQPGGTVCSINASAGSARVHFDIWTYRLSQISIVPELPANPTPGASFQVPVKVRMGIYSLPNVQLGARIVSGPSAVSPASANTGQGEGVMLTVDPHASGDFELELSVRTLTKRVPIQFAPAADPVHQDMWWDPTQSGWGVSIVEHRDQLFVMIYAYDDAGRPTWYVISNGSWAGNAFTGQVYSPRGAPFYAYDTTRLVMGQPVGASTLTFADANHATLDYTINGVHGTKSITRYLFGPPAAAPLIGRSDMWWGGLSQSGWGLAVLQQNAMLFVMWYTYDAEGRPVWYAMTSGAWTSSDTFEGRIHRTTSSPWLGRAYDAAQLRLIDVGSYRLKFVGDSAIFDYTVDGRTGSLTLARFNF